MSDRQTKALRERVEARLGPLHEIDGPRTADEAAKLAREDPDAFDALFEAGLIMLEGENGERKR